MYVRDFVPLLVSTRFRLLPVHSFVQTIPKGWLIEGRVFRVAGRSTTTPTTVGRPTATTGNRPIATTTMGFVWRALFT